ncbi:hypothetical protein AB0G67_48000 [Streptomyces sp. NPDC021056]|uniref:hypothetical protein n=1 Tax=Streptomyces sp. NPDC021056 TaxID=3155012 RepID=UPI0034006BEF
MDGTGSSPRAGSPSATFSAHHEARWLWRCPETGNRDTDAPTGQRAWPDREHLTSLPSARIQAFDTSRGRVTRLTAHRDTWTQAPCDPPVADPALRRTATALLADEGGIPSAPGA